MKIKVTCTIVLTLLISLSSNCFGQGTSGGQSVGSEIIDFEGVFESLHHQQILQGKQYRYFYPSIKGHQYWDKAIYATGSLTFEGVIYQNILLNYDLYNDLVMIAMVRNGLTENIILDNTRIDNFMVESANFVNIRDSTEIIAPGIYRLAFDQNEVQLYIQAKKSVAGNNGRGEQLKKFVEENTFLLVMNGVVHNIENKKDLLKALETGSPVANYIKDHSLKFRNHNQIETSLLIILERFYSSDL
ncbi:MAG: hypothetical protein ACR2MX_03120 [Cyclobacteriaceae bacterium]